MSGGILGIDLDDWSAQISFWLPGAQTPETISTGDGEEDRIPAVLCRRTDRDVWTYGKEALETARRGGGVLADRLLSRALAGEQLEIGGEWFEAAALLALFIKRSLSLLGGAMRPEKADFFMFTLERVDRQALEMVERIALLLSLPPELPCRTATRQAFPPTGPSPTTPLTKTSSAALSNSTRTAPQASKSPPSSARVTLSSIPSIPPAPTP